MKNVASIDIGLFFVLNLTIETWFFVREQIGWFRIGFFLMWLLRSLILRFFVGAGLFLFLFYLASFFFSFRKCTQVQEQEIIVKIKYLKGNSRFFSCSWYYSAHGNEASGLYWNWREIYYVIRIFTTCMISWKVNMSSKEFANFFETSPVYC